ncbi:uncharacterized protein LOC130795060 isoform X1 [Actinidia eriantha]|uniref:uncharacterized protein LOC130795060 isoform X1 n=1 Tax=Actinidia eriantha TaxID=165200 RepID=UPI00258DE5E4|nr:uncharacterized protein LOC130795060 isoform X1 [Actinidia eriantha]
MPRKKTPKRKKREKVQQIDHIPKCWQQPRTPGGPRRRTDFSLFFCSSFSSLSNCRLGKGLLLESSSSIDNLTSATITKSTDFEETRVKGKEIIELPVVHCSKDLDKRRGLFSDFIEVPIIEVESITQNALLESCSDRNHKQKSDIVEFTPDKSYITESSNFSTTPRSVVWAKTGRQLWCPAESFEERSCDPVEEFQDASNQTIQQRECQSMGKEFIESSDDTKCSIKRDQSPDQWNSSSSSRTEIDCLERRRGKRERKPKVHFDEVTIPLKSVRKVRRFKIMRFLGLAAPVGSPFNISPCKNFF